MTQRSNSAAVEQIVSPARGVENIQEIVRLARARGRTLKGIAEEAGVDLGTIRGWIEDGKEPSYSRAMSVIAVCGQPAVAKSNAMIGYGGAEPLDEGDHEIQPAQRAADALCNLSIIVQDTVGNRIDHRRERECREAADKVIFDLLPLSSAGRAE